MCFLDTSEFSSEVELKSSQTTWQMKVWKGQFPHQRIEKNVAKSRPDDATRPSFNRKAFKKEPLHNGVEFILKSHFEFTYFFTFDSTNILSTNTFNFETSKNNCKITQQ